VKPSTVQPPGDRESNALRAAGPGDDGDRLLRDSHRAMIEVAGTDPSPTTPFWHSSGLPFADTTAAEAPDPIAVMANRTKRFLDALIEPRSYLNAFYILK
jgi:hypothetical protein